jgi:hypothetical protein
MDYISKTNIKRENEFKVKDIDMYIRAKNWSLSTKKERVAMLKHFTGVIRCIGGNK